VEFNLLRLDLAERQQQWKLQMRAILARGQMEWTDGEKKLKTNYETWLGDTRDSYDTKSGSWNDKYLDFLKDKETWVRTVTAQSAMIGDQDVLENFGQSTQAAIDAAGADVIVTDMESAKDPDELLGEALDLTLLSKLLENADSLNRSISMFKPAIFTALDPDQYTSADLLQKIKDGQTADDEELRKRTLILQYERMLDQARAAEKQITDQVTEANAGVDRSLNGTLADAGYERSGAAYVKDAVVGSAVTGLITKRVSVKTYDYFTNLDLKIAEETSVNEDALLTLGSDALDQLLDKVMNKIETRTKAIFGDDEDLSTFMIPEGLTHNEKGVDYYAGESIDGKFQGEQTDKTKIEQKFTQQIEWIETVYEEVATQARTGGRRGPDGEGAEEEPARIPTYVKHTLTRGVDLSPGEFGAHVGYAPGFSDKVDVDADKAWDAEGNIQFQGLGQMGTIMGQFIYNSMLEGKGWGEANLPGYSKRLWDDSGDLIKAPTMRGVIDMGITVATMAIPGGQLISAVMNLADDALFTALDVGNSQMSWQEGLLSFGKQVAVKALTPGGLPGGGTLLEKAVSVVGSGFANNMIGGMINSFEFNYDDDGNISGFGMNGDVIRDSLVGKGALAGYASAFASSLVSGGVAGGMKGLEGGFYEAAANIAGDVAGQAAKYGVYLGSSILENGWGDLGSQAVNAFDDMGGITINIANLGALLDAGQILGFTQDGWDGEKTAEMNGAIDRLSGAGLFELNFSSKGMTGRLGMGGMNLGGNLYKLGKGVVADTMLRNQYGGRDSGEGFALAANYALGDDLGEDMMWRVLLGKDTVSYDRSNADGNKLEAETTRTDEGNRVFHFDSSLAGASGDDAMLLATAFQHESWRNGLDDGAAGQRTETIGAAFAHTEMALALARTFGGDSFISNSANLSDDVDAYFKVKGDKDSFGAYAEEKYKSTGGDFWKVIKGSDGKVLGVLDDKNYETITYVDAFGETLEEQAVHGSLTQQIADSTGEIQSKAEINQLMMSSGLWHSGKSGTRWYVSDTAKQQTVSHMMAMSRLPESTQSDQPFLQRIGLDGVMSQYAEAQLIQAEAAIEMGSAIRSGFGSFVSWVTGRDTTTESAVQLKPPKDMIQQLMIPNMLDVRSLGMLPYMQTADSELMLGTSEYSVNRYGCFITAAIRDMNILGGAYSLDLAKKASYFNSDGELQPSIFTNNGFELNILEGPFDSNASVKSAMDTLMKLDRPFAVYGSAPFGTGKHAVNINSFVRLPDGRYDIGSFTETSTTGESESRMYSFYLHPEKTNI